MRKVLFHRTTNVLAVAFLAGFLTVSAALRIGTLTREPVQYAPAYGLRGTTEELLAVLVISSDCRYDAAFPNAIERLKVTLARRARATSRTFAAIAVVVDWSPRNAARFIKQFGQFDEILLGRNWLNTGVVRYVWRDLPGPPQVPQVIVVKRRVEVSERSIHVGGEAEVVRKLGTTEILEWVEQNLPMPGLALNTERDEASNSNSTTPR
ncbi:MAG: hypothetical protein KatS3mg081_1051 [Gemmatimonadales bacterium]|nr:MAG: hypothetical protein KatS3mg081_1051 [Gemmatimonadales bacterium]